jgi:hypothetical protein
MISQPRQFKLTDGVDAYNPPVVGDLLTFLYLNNVEPRLGRLFATRGYELFQDLELETDDKIVDFGFYQLENRQYYNLYAFSKTSVYWFDFELEAFDTTAIYSGFTESDDPYVLLKWYGALYVTKPYSPYVRLQRQIATVISDAPFGRYGVVANSHAFLGAVGTMLDASLAMLRWSDLDDPESFAVDPNESEADFFNLEPDGGQITGMSYQRGSVITYLENGIWISRAVGFPGGFRHEPLFPGLGNIFHNAVVRGKEVDYFIGQDDIYALNGLQVVPIGEKIFQRFIDDIKINIATSVRGYLDSRKDQVFWVYTKNDDSLNSIVYNYREQKWSERDPQDLSGWLDTPRVAMTGYKVIDDYDDPVADIIDDQDAIIDDPNEGFPVVLPQLLGTLDDGEIPVVGKSIGAFLKMDGTEFAHEIETFDFFFETFGQVNEVHKALLEYLGTGNADLQISLGIRANQTATITWSTSLDINTTTESSLAFFFKSAGVGKYIRFKFTWANTEDDNVIDLRLLSLEKIDTQESDYGQPEK